MNTNLEILSSHQIQAQRPGHIGFGNTKATTETGKSNSTFENYLLDAINYVNEKQQASTDITQQLVIDPESVDVHDVTTAMAEANLSLSIAQNVIDRLTKAWSEITTTR